MARFNDAWMETLLGKNDIVSLVSEYVQLRAKGRKLWGLCPFHGEKTPSFSVSEDKQLFYCFGCHAGGGIIQFVMDIEKLPYMEAIQFLAQRAGMEMPDEIDDEQLRRERARKERLYAACKEAALYFHAQLKDEAGAQARKYLASRGLSAQVVSKFGLGYAPDSWDSLLFHMKEKGYKENDLVDAGLLVHNAKTNNVYDAYRNRVTFPIIGVNSRVLGFGARTMGSDTPKYINTGDTPVYSKRRNLYAMQMLKSAKASDAVMVEGYMDVISLYAAGIHNAVASLGTSLTEQQARLLKRYVSTVYIAYDGDTAGQNATLRGLDILQKEGLRVRVIEIPPGLDPDDLVRKGGKDAFDRLKEKAVSLHAFKLMRMGAEYDLQTEDGRQEYAMAGCRFIATLQPVEQERYYAALSRKTGLSMEALKAQGAKGGVPAGDDISNISPGRRGGRARREDATPERERLELMILQAMLQSQDAATTLRDGGLEQVFSDEALRAFAHSLLETYKEGKVPDIAMLMSSLMPEQARVIASMAGLDETQGDHAQFALDCIRRIRVLDIEEEIRQLRNEVGKEEIPLQTKLETMQRIKELEVMIRELR